MGKEYAVQKGARPLAQPLLAMLYPRLRELPPERRSAALERARDEPLDGFETAGIGGSVALAVWLLEPAGAGPEARSLAAQFVYQYLAALPLLAAIAGPLLLRRTRRGLERELRRPQP